MWNFSHAVGALKLIRIECSKLSGTIWLQYDLLQYGFTQFAMPIIVLLCMSLEVTEITMKAAS